ncbi:hypothetical protein EI94DRAFT_1556419, partial [Lactarius quietus]
ERLSKDWDAPIYTFFKPMPVVEYIDQRKAHVFECAAHSCHGWSRFVRRYLDTGDAKSTSNLRRHAKLCWGEEIVTTADDARNAKTAREALRHGKKVNGSIMSAFQRIAKGQVTYSHCQHTKLEARVEFIRWVAESKWPFQIVNDRGFHSLMKTGRPEYHIPSQQTLSHDVQNVFVRVHGQIVKLLQEYDGKLNFAINAWTSPNHKVYVAITVHLEQEGKPMAMLLDMVKV